LNLTIALSGGDGTSGKETTALMQQANNTGVDGAGQEMKLIHTSQSGAAHYTHQSHSSSSRSHRSVTHTTTGGGQPLIRLKVNEQVYDGVIDPQQHIHLIPVHVQEQPTQQPSQ
jgi:hypothetical protein